MDSDLVAGIIVAETYFYGYKAVLNSWFDNNAPKNNLGDFMRKQLKIGSCLPTPIDMIYFTGVAVASKFVKGSENLSQPNPQLTQPRESYDDANSQDNLLNFRKTPSIVDMVDEPISLSSRNTIENL